MSRIGRLPIPVPAGVTVTVDDENNVTVKGPKGELSQKVNKDIKVEQVGAEVLISRPSDSKPHRFPCATNKSDKPLRTRRVRGPVQSNPRLEGLQRTANLKEWCKMINKANTKDLCEHNYSN